MSAHIVAIGGGGFDETETLHRYVLALARSERPRVCFVPTASGDDPGYYRAFSKLDCVPSDL